MLVRFQEGPHVFFTHYQEAFTKHKAVKWVLLCACPILIISDLNYEVKGTFSADLCQGQLFSNLAILDSRKNGHCVTSYGQIRRLCHNLLHQNNSLMYVLYAHMYVYCIVTCNGLFDYCKQINIFMKMYLEMSLSYRIASNKRCNMLDSKYLIFWSESEISIIATTIHR